MVDFGKIAVFWAVTALAAGAASAQSADICRSPGEIWPRAQIFATLPGTTLAGRNADGALWSLSLHPSEGGTAPATFTPADGAAVKGSFGVVRNFLCQTYFAGVDPVCHQFQDCNDAAGPGPIMIDEQGLQSSRVLSITPDAPPDWLCAEPGEKYYKERLDTLVRSRRMVMQTDDGTDVSYDFLSDGTGLRKSAGGPPETMRWQINFARICAMFPEDARDCMAIRGCASGEAAFVVLGADGGQAGLVSQFQVLDNPETAPSPAVSALSDRESRASTECAGMDSALARLDCFDALFPGAAAAGGDAPAPPALPDTERLRADLIGQRLLDPNNNALGVGRRYFDIGGLSSIVATQIVGTTQTRELAEIVFGVLLRDAATDNLYETEVNMVYRRGTQNWRLQNIAMLRNFTVTPGR